MTLNPGAETKKLGSPYVFISYTWSDSERVYPLVNGLREKKIQCWVDKERMTGGVHLTEEMAKGVLNSEALIVCYSNKYCESKRTRQEVDLADKHNIPLIPVRCQADYTPDPWLDILLGNTIYTDVTEMPFEAAACSIVVTLKADREKRKSALETNEVIARSFADLVAAVRADDVAAVDNLLVTEPAIRVNKMDSQGNTPLHHLRSVAIAALLVGNGADVSARENQSGRTPLHKMATSKDQNVLELVRFFLQQGASAAARDNKGRTALWLASYHGNSEVVRLLVTAGGCDVNAADDTGLTPLHGAAQQGKESTCELLVEMGADLNATAKTGRTPLHNAAAGNSVDSARFLICKGSDVNARAASERTPLHIAAHLGCEDVVDFLLTSGAEVDAVDAGGETALHRATRQGNSRVCVRLLKFGADTSIENIHGNQPIDLVNKEDTATRDAIRSPYDAS